MRNTILLDMLSFQYFKRIFSQPHIPLKSPSYKKGRDCHHKLRVLMVAAAKPAQPDWYCFCQLLSHCEDLEYRGPPSNHLAQWMRNLGVECYIPDFDPRQTFAVHRRQHTGLPAPSLLVFLPLTSFFFHYLLLRSQISCLINCLEA